MSVIQGDAAVGAFKVNSLSELETADPSKGRLVWDWPRPIWNMSFYWAHSFLARCFSLGTRLRFF
jgi:stearoyl-CoA desaturase (delta-9 desaturase)